jgi:hypothetical protein
MGLLLKRINTNKVKAAFEKKGEGTTLALLTSYSMLQIAGYRI